MERLILPALLAVVWCSATFAADLMPGFHRSSFLGEQVREQKTDSGVRLLFNAPDEVRADRPTLVIFYATPNGNTIEQTMGSAMAPDLDWHFDIQHIAAQTRRLREIDKAENIVLVCMQAEERSWPTWRQKRPDNALLIRGMIEDAVKGLPGSEVRVVLTGHSGGGSMITGFINSGDAIPNWVKRIAYLDANYSYDDDRKHGDKLLAWLRDNKQHHLVVIAYDDREITLDGKKVVGPTGGTFRASHRMLSRFEKDLTVKRSAYGQFDRYDLANGQCTMFLHRNPQNKILHTVLVGEMNGLLQAMTLGTPLAGKWGTFGGPRAYTRWVQPAATSIDVIPSRPKHARGGRAVMESISKSSLEEREKALTAELTAGNLPAVLREFTAIRVQGKDADGREHTVVYHVMPDYLSVGSDSDFVRAPITPMAAQSIADAFGCSMPTRKMVNDIYEQSVIKLEPKPLTKDREIVDTFIQHNSIIEGQRAGKPLDGLVAGTKKDVVITNLLQERPDHVAIYGWHKLDGSPIQPLTTVHVNWYVDYSHGIRLVRRTVLVDGNPRDIREVLSNPVLHPLLSDEGPIARPYYWGETHPKSGTR